MTIEYNEGAEIGYRWHAKTGATPLYPFGHGLSYTRFDYSDLQVEGGEAITPTFTITITTTGERAGADVPQLYLTEAAGEKRRRLLAFERVELEPGQSRQVSLAADPRLLARFDGHAGQWHLADGGFGRNVFLAPNGDLYEANTKIATGVSSAQARFNSNNISVIGYVASSGC